MRLVLAATVTELLELKPARGRLLVLRSRVVPFLALSALQCHNFPHLQIPFEFKVHSPQLPAPVSGTSNCEL